MEDAVVPEAEQREIALSDDALIRNKRAETMEKIHIWDERVPFFLPGFMATDPDNYKCSFFLSLD